MGISRSKLNVYLFILIYNLDMSWKLINSKKIYKDKFMTLEVDDILTELGDKVVYSIVRKKPCALIIPWDGKNFLLEKLYRFAISEYSWEFPCGHFQGESVEQTARNELEEETGYKAGSLKKIGVFHPANGFLDQECHVFLAANLTKGKMNRETSEKGMKVVKVTSEKLEKMIKGGEIRDALTLSGYLLFKESGF